MNSPLGSESNVTSTLGPFRILLAEDHLLSQTATVRLLQAEGHDVFVVDNGDDAVAAWRDQQFDFVLMDLQLPGMGGLDAIRAIRDSRFIHGDHRAHVWALTADSGDAVVAACLAAGADGHLAKPLKPRQLSLLLQGPHKSPQGSEKADSSAADGSAGGGAVEDSHREILMASVGQDQALAISLVELFLVKFEALFHRVQLSIQCCDFSTLLLEAHSLKSPARIFGAKKLHGLCDVIEQICRLRDHEQLTSVGDSFLAELQELRRVVSEIQ